MTMQRNINYRKKLKSWNKVNLNKNKKKNKIKTYNFHFQTKKFKEIINNY